MSSAALAPASRLRTASVTSAPAPASERAVSTPIPDEAPVTTARTPVRSRPATTSSAVLPASNRVVISREDVAMNLTIHRLHILYSSYSCWYGFGYDRSGE